MVKNKFIEIRKTNTNSFRTIWDRPKKAENVEYRILTASNTDAGIVLQGPLMLEDDFTLETTRLYRKLYPDTPIVVSTWKASNESEKKTLSIMKDEGILIVESELPKNPGVTNINFQRYNTGKGIEKIKELGCKYVWKTRTDQRFYANNLITFFNHLLNKFPLRIETNATDRLIACSTGTFSNRLYNISDLMMYGNVEDVYRFFWPEEDERPKADIICDMEDILGYCKKRPGEIYFTSHYIEQCGHKLKWTLEDSDYYRQELFIVLDSESLDQFWPKYTDYEYRWRRYQLDVWEQVTFKDWFCDWARR